MECVDGVDFSWIGQNSNHRTPGYCLKDSCPQAQTTAESSATKVKVEDPRISANEIEQSTRIAVPATSKLVTIPHRASSAKITSTDKTVIPSSVASPGIRRNSWLSSISSKFTSTSSHTQLSSSFTSPSLVIGLDNTESTIPTGPSAPKNAVLPHAQKNYGDCPYIPALPRTSHSSFLQSALRRLSNSSGLGTTTQAKLQQESGLCERRVLNVDKNRERCKIKGLNEAKLRRVAFCVDVQVANPPKYDEMAKQEKVVKKSKKQKEKQSSEPERNESPEILKPTEECIDLDKSVLGIYSEVNHFTSSRKISRKKEKKKRNEEERKVKKEKQRKLAEAYGTVPLEVKISNSETPNVTPNLTTKSQDFPTTDPVRIYRRCCQLRETPVLKRIAEQLVDAKNQSQIPGVINRLDLSGHWIDTSDIITLGDYLAIVPVTDLVMENCGLNDESIRVILAGLLATKQPNLESGPSTRCTESSAIHGGFVEMIILKNNPSIGKDGWQYICTFIAMCRSLKSLDLSLIPIPQLSSISTDKTSPKEDEYVNINDVTKMLGKAISGRLGGKNFALLNMAECNLSDDQIGNLIDGIIDSGLCHLSLAGNKLNSSGIHHIVRFIRNGKCESLDLSCNDLETQLGTIAEALTEENNLCALTLIDCNLTPYSLWSLFPALVKLKSFRFIDLSENPRLFSLEPSSLSLFRRYLPQMESLKRIHLTSVSLTSEQAIALAEILPESPNLAHINIMENPLRAAIQTSNAKIEAKQEEACALYASLMAAVRVSKTLICVDVEVPSSDSSEIVKALAKQVVAYCLWNMEHGPVAEISADNGVKEEKDVAVPDVLLNLVGHGEEDMADNPDLEEPAAPDEDYVIGGTGVVKALSICLRNHGNDLRPRSASSSISSSKIPSTTKGDRAKDMSKNLLGTARNIRARLQTAVKESKGDTSNHQRLLFLDQTLETLIKRFEDEFPETRLIPPLSCSPSILQDFNQISRKHISQCSNSDQDSKPAYMEATLSDDECSCIRPVISRHNSEVSIASRALGEEEGRMHRLSQQLKMDSFKSDEEIDGDDNPVTDWSVRLEMLKGMVGVVSAEKSFARENAMGR